MDWTRPLLLVGLLLAAGCQSAPPEDAPPAPFKLNKSKSAEITPDGNEFGQRRQAAKTAKQRGGTQASGEIDEGDLFQLPKFTVTQKSFANFGLSVVTNTEVLRGGDIEWMRVGIVLPGSAADRAGLRAGTEILAINGWPVSKLTREDMLHALFEQEPGGAVRLLVTSRQFGLLPLFVLLHVPAGPAK
jgi:hypothetical protein